MKTYLIDGDRYPSAAALHAALKAMMDLPEYYGGNADALYDCLSERKPVRLWIVSRGNADVDAALAKVCAVVTDLDGVAE